MILGLGVPELAVILAVCLVIFGPKNLPKLGSSIGKTVKNFREGMEGDGGEPAPASAGAHAHETVSEAVAVDPDDVDAE
ncbi:MAG: twin-arginine translocase TatA/TatE family subunit [Coriobacteriia bacterium]|nr:twin-arginine translocase TatA/TatE family subunit [Coriobacteriia bacterium]